VRRTLLLLVFLCLPTGIAVGLVEMLRVKSGPPGRPVAPAGTVAPARTVAPTQPPRKRSVKAARASRTPTKIAHVVWVLMENRDLGRIIGPRVATPYLSQLAHTFGYASSYQALAHPSLANYIALTSGSTHGIKHDRNPSLRPIPGLTYALGGPSIFSQLPGGRSRSLLESMPRNCDRINHSRYLTRHNPEAYYTNVRKVCTRYNLPLGAAPDLRAAFTFIAPNVQHDMHDGSTQQGDQWMAQFTPRLMATPQYKSGRTVIFITWDEGGNARGGETAGNHVPLIVVSPYTHHRVYTAPANHYALLRTTEELLALPPLGNAAPASSFAKAFGL
jgi:phosphatidylinositol-3-phosphatase